MGITYLGKYSVGVHYVKEVCKVDWGSDAHLDCCHIVEISSFLDYYIISFFHLKPCDDSKAHAENMSK